MIANDTVVTLKNGRVKNVESPEILLQNDHWYRSHIAYTTFKYFIHFLYGHFITSIPFHIPP